MFDSRFSKYTPYRLLASFLLASLLWCCVQIFSNRRNKTQRPLQMHVWILSHHRNVFWSQSNVNSHYQSRVLLRYIFGYKWLNKLSCIDIFSVLNHVQYMYYFSANKGSVYFSIESDNFGSNVTRYDFHSILIYWVKLTDSFVTFQISSVLGLVTCVPEDLTRFYRLLAGGWRKCSWSLYDFSKVNKN